MKNFKRFIKKLWRDEDGQGIAEYVLLVALVVGIILAFGGPIRDSITNKVDEVRGQIQAGPFGN